MPKKVINQKFKKVPMPTCKIVVIRNIYVYYYTEIFRNSKNEPDNKRVLIGKKDGDMLVPNRNYFAIFGDKDKKENEINISCIKRIGEFLLVDKIVEELGVNKILNKTFPDICAEILTLSMYFLTTAKAMMYIDDWCEDNYIFSTKIIYSQDTSDIFKSIDLDSRNVFFKEWAAKNKNDEYTAFDITSMSSYCQNNEYVEWGYNRDSEDLPQINIGTFVGEKSKLPVYYTTYSGSITDQVYLPFMLEGIEELGIKISKFVMDRGFFNNKNLKYMIGKNQTFIVCAKENKAIRDLIHEQISNIRSAKNYSLEYKIYTSSYESIINGKKVKVHIFYDTDKITKDEESMYILIDEYDKELQKLTILTAKTAKKYKRFFDIKIETDGKFTYEKDFTKIEKERELLGYFACMTNDLNLSSEEVLKIYRLKDIVEKYFDNLKNFVDSNRSRTHFTSTFEGKLFVVFIGLIYKSYIEVKLGKYIRENSLTVDKILLELSKIKLLTVNGKNRLYQPLTKKQKDILNHFGITEVYVNDKIAVI